MDPPLPCRKAWVTTGEVRTISRKPRGASFEGSSETVRRTLNTAGMIQSGLRGDTQSRAEMTRPPRSVRISAVTIVSVPIRRGRRKLEGSCPQYERTGADVPLVCQLSRQRHGWLATYGRDKR